MEHPQQDLHRELFPLVLKLTQADQRESALLELSKKRESFQDLAPILWHSVGTMSALLQVPTNPRHSSLLVWRDAARRDGDGGHPGDLCPLRRPHRRRS